MVQFNLIFQADAEHLFMFPTVVEKQKSFDLSVTPKNPWVMGTLLWAAVCTYVWYLNPVYGFGFSASINGPVQIGWLIKADVHDGFQYECASWSGLPVT